MTRYGYGYDPDYYGGARFYRGFEVDQRDRRYMAGAGRFGTMRGYDMRGGYGGRRLRTEAPPQQGGPRRATRYERDYSRALRRDAPDWRRLHWQGLPPRH